MAKSRKKKKAVDEGLPLIYVHFRRAPEEELDIQFLLEDLVGEEGEVRGSREGPDGDFCTEEEGWGYEVLIHDPAAVDGWVERLCAELPAILKGAGERQRPWLEVSLDRPDEPKNVLRRIDRPW